MPDILTAFSLLAVVLLLSALASGVVERAPLSFPLLFLGIGVLLGEQGLGYLHVEPHDATLEVVATVSLALVLFLDAVKLRFDESSWVVPALVLGPGTLLTIAIVAGAGMLLLGLPPLVAVLMGAILSSTDPVVLRDVTRDRRIPRPVRRILSIESGTNDVVVLPIVLVLIAVLQGKGGSAGEWLAFLGRLFVLSPVVGFAVGGLGSWLMRRVDDRFSIRREYQALYGLGLVLAAFAAGQAVQGDGFLAAFAGGVAVVVLNQELCDCFLEYGDVTAEMAMLLAFILFGALLSSMLAAGVVPLLPAAALAAVTLLVARPAAMLLVLAPASLSGTARGFIAWFGPRGLSSLLLALLVVIGHVPDAERLLALTGVVVIASVVAHGVSATPLAAWYARRLGRETHAEERGGQAADVFDHYGALSQLGHLGHEETEEPAPRMDVAELAARLARPQPPVVLDVRSRSGYEAADGQIPGSIRVVPDQAVEWAQQAQQERQQREQQRQRAPGGPDGQDGQRDGEAAARAVVAYCT